MAYNIALISHLSNIFLQKNVKKRKKTKDVHFFWHFFQKGCILYKEEYVCKQPGKAVKISRWEGMGMKIHEIKQFDHIVIGSGLAGLTCAFHLAKSGKSVAVFTKREIDECNSRFAQGGVACVMDKFDSFDEHVADTLTAGAGM